MEWSIVKYHDRFNVFSDNIRGVPLQARLCSPMPIDLVYTWVNGSDPLLIEAITKAKMELEQQERLEAALRANASLTAGRANGTAALPWPGPGTSAPVPTPQATALPSPLATGTCENGTDCTVERNEMAMSRFQGAHGDHGVASGKLRSRRGALTRGSHGFCRQSGVALLVAIRGEVCAVGATHFYRDQRTDTALAESRSPARDACDARGDL